MTRLELATLTLARRCSTSRMSVSCDDVRAVVRGFQDSQRFVWIAERDLLSPPLRERVTSNGYAPIMIRTLDLAGWAGRWVAVDSQNHVRCDAASLAELLDVLATADLGDVEVMRAPTPGEPVVFGLG